MGESAKPDENPREAEITSAAVAELVETQGVSNPLFVLEELAARGLPPASFRLHPGIEAMAAMIADTGDDPGSEWHQIEQALRISVYLDRLLAARCNR